jgi:four helix bundle protein
MIGMMPYERLEAWELSHELVLAVYRASSNWPKSEVYGLTSQARRSAASVSMNLAEGAAKRGPREFRRYLDTSLGSLSELDYILRLAHDLGYLNSGDWEVLRESRDGAGKALWGLYRAISRASAGR